VIPLAIIVPVVAIYACFFAGLGLLQPLFPLFLTDHGMPAHMATRVLALGPLAAVLVPPAVGLFADAFRARASILRVAMMLCTLSILAYLRMPTGMTALVVISIVYSVLRAPIAMLVDAAAYATAERDGSSYGRLRLFGSLGFLVAVVAGGALTQTYGWDALLVATAIAFALAFGACMLLPAQLTTAHRRAPVSLLPLLQRRELWLFLAVVAVSQMASAAYDSCYALHLTQLGHSERFVGVAWGIGVLAEACVLVWSARLVRKWGAERLLTLAFVTMAVRWLLVAIATATPAILALQLLHGITYPLYWVPAVMLVHRLAPRDLATAAQGLLAAAAGLGSVAGMAMAGQVLEAGGGARVYTYAATIALIAALGALLLPRAPVARGV
jgi:MFS transporter, PPP family, 3-phenylpropionic acid transporter